jgi:hypothetical protein
LVVFGLNLRNGRWRIYYLPAIFFQAVAVGRLSAVVVDGGGRCVEIFSVNCSDLNLQQLVCRCGGG